MGVYGYRERFYDFYITHFSQPDTIVPDQYNPLDWNRYAYARYNPVKYTDPTGHMVDDGCRTEGCATDEEERNKKNNPVIEKLIRGKEKDSKANCKFSSTFCDWPLNADYYSFSVYSDILGQAFVSPVLLASLAEPTPGGELLAIIAAAVLSGGVTLTIDRYGQIYITPGASVGRSIIPAATGVHISVMAISGYIKNNPSGTAASPEQLSGLLTDLGFNHSAAGALNAGGVTWSPSSPDLGFEFGFGFPPQINMGTAGWGFGPFSLLNLNNKRLW